MVKKCIYCSEVVEDSSVVDMCQSCMYQVWGEKMSKAIIKNMEGERDKGNLDLGQVGVKKISDVVPVVEFEEAEVTRELEIIESVVAVEKVAFESVEPEELVISDVPKIEEVTQMSEELYSEEGEGSVEQPASTDSESFIS